MAYLLGVAGRVVTAAATGGRAWPDALEAVAQARERFAEAMARAKARLRAHEAQSAQLASLLRTVAAPNQYVTRLAARDGGRTTLIDVDRVEWIKAAENYVELHVGRARVRAELVRGLGADDHGRDRRARQQPGERDLI